MRNAWRSSTDYTELWDFGINPLCQEHVIDCDQVEIFLLYFFVNFVGVHKAIFGNHKHIFGFTYPD